MRLRRLLVLPLLIAPTVAFAQIAPSVSGALSPAAMEAIDKRLTIVEKDLDAGKKELAAIGPKKVAAAHRARVRGRALYRLMRAGLMPLGGGFSSFVDHAQRVERLKHAVKLDLEEDVVLGARASALATSLSSLAKERTELTEKKQILDAAKVALDEEKRRRESFESAFASSIGPSPAMSKADGEIYVYGPSGKSVPESLDPGSFRARKGRLTFPVAGQAEVKSAFREGGPGLEIKAALGATVRAVHAGRVAFADRYGTYGPLVILDHGDRCYTVSANLGTIDVKVGDEVSAGEKLGTVGDDGRGPSLYFEIRVGNDKLAPAAWLGL
ncbi:MAG: peptidoglycan DD-metalloendopeptidase family protein [Deltaproteobacteria bacterium]|nr:peptidoglycan DD-metalloendopeptidase family protein [Deltaproteobacteria bacterium]